jgi:hypothetical protein
MSEPRVWHALITTETVNENGTIEFAEGIISTHGGGNITWETESIPFVEKTHYDELKAEVERIHHEHSQKYTELMHECERLRVENGECQECSDKVAELLAHAEKLADHLHTANLGKSLSHPALVALAEFRAKFPKGE